MKRWSLPRAVLPIYGTTFADTLGYTLMIPLLPTLVHQYHAPDIVGGALLSIPAFCSAVAAPIWGKASDRLGRKTIILASQVLSLAGYVILALSHTIWLVLLSRVISGCGGGSLGAVESYIADVTNNDQRERAYSLYGAAFGVAFIFGPVLSGALLRHGIALPFFVAAFLELLNIIFTALFLPLHTRDTQPKTSIEASLHAAARPGVRRVFAAQFLFIFAVVCFLANFGLYVEHVLRLEPSHASYLLAGAGIVGGVTLIAIVTPLARRFGDRVTALAGLAISVVAYLWLALVTGPWMFAAALALWAAGAAIVEPTLTTLLSRRAQKEERGALMGIGDSINSVAMIVGPSAGAALVGSEPRLLGVLSAIAAGTAFVVGWRGRGASGKDGNR